MSVLVKVDDFHYKLVDPGQSAGVNSRFASNFFHSFQVDEIVNSDGTGTNLSLAAAITALGTAGGVVHLKSDTASVATGLTIPAGTSNLIIRGTNTQLFENTGTVGGSVGVTIGANCSNIRIEGIHWKNWETVFSAADSTPDKIWVSNNLLEGHTTSNTFSVDGISNFVYDTSNID